MNCSILNRIGQNNLRTIHRCNINSSTPLKFDSNYVAEVISEYIENYKNTNSFEIGNYELQFTYQNRLSYLYKIEGGIIKNIIMNKGILIDYNFHINIDKCTNIVIIQILGYRFGKGSYYIDRGLSNKRSRYDQHEDGELPNINFLPDIDTSPKSTSIDSSAHIAISTAEKLATEFIDKLKSDEEAKSAVPLIDTSFASPEIKETKSVTPHSSGVISEVTEESNTVSTDNKKRSRTQFESFKNISETDWTADQKKIAYSALLSCPDLFMSIMNTDWSAEEKEMAFSSILSISPGIKRNGETHDTKVIL
jgi:hypothetical protein